MDDLRFPTKSFQTKFGTIELPVFGDPDITDKLKITWHWSAGSYGVGSACREHYNLVAGRNGKLVQAIPIEYQIVTSEYPRHPKYAAHVRNGNSNNIAVSVAAMGGSHEWKARRGDFGPYPMTPEQVEFLIEMAAWICWYYEIPIIPTRVLGHVEWRTVLGVPQDRWDVGCIPHLNIRPRELPDGTWESLNYLRSRVRQRVNEISRDQTETDVSVPSVVDDQARLEFVTDIHENLKQLYKLVAIAPLSHVERHQALRGLNIFNSALVSANLKPEDD